MQMTYQIARSIGFDVGNKSMREAGRKIWSRKDYNTASKASYEAFPPCAEGFHDVCKCTKCVKESRG